MTPTIAIAEDEEPLREAVAEYLEGRGMRVFAAADAGAFRAIADREPIDVAVLDIAMPDETGLSLARWLKARGPLPGIIFATAAGQSRDRVEGLELGADDYIVKPYELRELLARINSVLRRLPAVTAPQPPARPAAATAAGTVRLGEWLLDPATGTIGREGEDMVSLSRKESDLLMALVSRPNRLLTRAQLLELVQGHDDDADLRSIDVRIARLRAKLEPAPDKPQFIRTIRGEGYMFVPGGA